MRNPGTPGNHRMYSLFNSSIWKISNKHVQTGVCKGVRAARLSQTSERSTDKPRFLLLWLIVFNTESRRNDALSRHSNTIQRSWGRGQGAPPSPGGGGGQSPAVAILLFPLKNLAKQQARRSWNVLAKNFSKLSSETVTNYAEHHQRASLSTPQIPDKRPHTGKRQQSLLT